MGRAGCQSKYSDQSARARTDRRGLLGDVGVAKADSMASSFKIIHEWSVVHARASVYYLLCTLASADSFHVVVLLGAT